MKITITKITLALSLITAAQFINNKLFAQTTFSNSSPITIVDNAPASLYPSPITVSGMSGTISNVTVSINGLSHLWVHDCSIILQAPTGQSLLIHSGVADGFSVSNINLTYSDAASTQMSSTNNLVSGTYKPTSYFWDMWMAPAPATPPGLGTYNAPGPFGPQTATFASTFNGINPNGQWKLFVADFASGDAGSISGGWSIAINTGFPLNTKLDYFETFCSNGNASIKWMYNNSKNLNLIEVQKSNDGINFESIEIVKPLGENLIHQVELPIFNSELENAFFRLKLIDIDNKITYSYVQQIKCDILNNTIVYPSISNSKFNIKSYSEEINTIEVFNTFGVTVASFNNLEQKIFSLDLSNSNFKSGVYFLKVTKNDVSEIIKIIKE